VNAKNSTTNRILFPFYFLTNMSEFNSTPNIQLRSLGLRMTAVRRC